MRPIAQRGFTLIELMITMVIIAILASIAVPSYQNYIKKSMIQEAQANLRAMSLAAESRYQRQLSYPPLPATGTSAVGSDTTAAKLSLPTWNPTSDKFNYQYVSDGTTYTLTASGNDSRVNGCKLTLTHIGTKSIIGCAPVSEWTN